MYHQVQQVGSLGVTDAQIFVVQGMLTRIHVVTPTSTAASLFVMTNVHQNNILRTDNPGQEFI